LFEVKPGKIMKSLTEELANFQILNPKATVDDCAQYLKTNKALLLAKFN